MSFLNEINQLHNMKKLRKKIIPEDQYFKINDFIEVRMIKGETQVYLGGEKFLQCRYLLMNFNEDDIKNTKDMNSMDEIIHYHNNHMSESYTKTIPREVEFRGHCSNLQVWAENEYSTDVIDSTLAFPMLKKLCYLGDPIAKKVYKDEIINKLKLGSKTNVSYLVANDHFMIFEEEELLMLIKNFKKKFYSRHLMTFMKYLHIPLIEDNVFYNLMHWIDGSEKEMVIMRSKLRNMKSKNINYIYNYIFKYKDNIEKYQKALENA